MKGKGQAVWGAKEPCQTAGSFLFALQHRYDVLFGDRLALLDADLFDHAIPIGSRRRYTADQ